MAMIKLSREIRFALVDDQAQISDRKTANSWAGWPATNLIVPQLVLRCVIAGQPDPRTGYLCNIKILDDLLRKIVVDQLIPLAGDSQSAEAIVRRVFASVVEQWDLDPEICELTLALSPYLEFSIHSKEPEMIQLTYQFEFSAAHRLHCDEFSDQQNREIFGKCNNPAGHGHNYVVDVTLGRELDADDKTGQVIEIGQFESIVKQHVIDRLDHKHLNHDVEYFASVNPSVENIAAVVFDWLDEAFKAAALGTAASLRRVRVYETPKTWAEAGV